VGLVFLSNKYTDFVVLSFIRSTYVILFMIAVCSSANAQDVTLEKVQRGDKVVVIAENVSEKPQLVTLDVSLENVVPDKKLPVELVLKPGEKKDLLILSPVPLKAWSYKTKFSFEEYIPEVEKEVVSTTRPRIPNNTPGAVTATQPIDYHLLPPDNTDDAPMPAAYARSMSSKNQDDHSTDNQIPESSLLMFGQAGCPRCAMVRSYLKEHDIPFKELSITGNSENQERMNEYLFDSGFEGGQFMMPVVIVDGETHYSIEDLSGFLDKLGLKY